MKYFILLLVALAGPLFGQSTDVHIKFAVIALDTDLETRLAFENHLVEQLIENNYDAVASHQLLPDISNIKDPALRSKLLSEGISAALVLRPLDIGTEATIEAVQKYLAPDDYNTLHEFVAGYRDDNFNTQAVIHLAGFLFDAERSMTFWQGVLWLDEVVENQQQGIEKLSELVLFNINQSRSALRKRLGLPPLSD